MIEKSKVKPVSYMLDSGSFSVWSRGQTIDIDAYAEYALRYEPYLKYIVNLDVIPGKPNQIASITKEDVESAAEQGYDNYLYLLKKGIPKEKLIHVFHQGEELYWLERMVKEIPYIGLSPANDRNTSEKMKWLDSIMPYCTDDKGYPLNKWHGFAVTSIKLAKRVPFFSVDSSSWAVQAGMGGVYMPKKRNGKYSYEVGDTFVLQVSAKSPAVKVPGKHITTLTQAERQEIMEYFKLCGVTLGRSVVEGPVERKGYKLRRGERWLGEDETAAGLFVDSKMPEAPEDGLAYIERVIEPGVTNDWRPRVRLNVLFFQELGKTFPPYPWPYKREKLGFGFRR